MAISPKIAEWKAWLKIVNVEIVGLHHDQHLHRQIMEFISQNTKLPKNSVVYEWLNTCYVNAAVSGVRRQLDTAGDVVSLRRLLDDILADPTVITRAWFVAQYGTLPTGHEDFDRFTAKPGDQHIDVAQVRNDIAQLTAAGQAVRIWVNKYIAHRDEDIALKRIASPPILTWEDLIKAISLLGDLLKKYELLINQRGMVDITPVIQEDWEQVFRVAWKLS